MRKISTGLLIAATALALAGCKQEAAPVAEATEAATTEAVDAATTPATASTDAGAATDAAPAATETTDPNGNPIKP